MISAVRTVASLLLSTFFMLMAGGLAGYLIPLRAVQEGWSTFAVSMIATGYAIAFTLSCIITPRLVLRVGHVRVFAAFVTLMAMSLLLHSLVVDPVAWVLIRAIAGFAIAGGYMVIESWLNERVSNENRGALFSVYMVTCMAALTAGQYIVPLGDISSTALFIVCALLFGAALLPTALSTAQSPAPLTQARFDIPGLFRRSPAAVAGMFLTGTIGGAWNGLAPVYGSQAGLSTGEGATMLAAAMIGGALFQYPLGRASDRMDRRRVMAFAGIFGTLASLAVLNFGVDIRLLFFALMFIFGMVLFPIYALNVAHANDHARPDEFVEVSSGLMLVYGIGTMIGPMIAGFTMEQIGPGGFFLFMGVNFALYGLYTLWRMSRREQAPEETRTDFSPMSPLREQTPQTVELDPRADPDFAGHAGNESNANDTGDDVPEPGRF